MVRPDSCQQPSPGVGNRIEKEDLVLREIEQGRETWNREVTWRIIMPAILNISVGSRASRRGQKKKVDHRFNPSLRRGVPNYQESGPQNLKRKVDLSTS